MNKYIQHYNLKPGDEIIVPKSDFNLIQHHALYIGFDEHGTDWVIHNTAGVGVSLITADDFFKLCLQVNGIRRFTGTNRERRQLVQRALQKIGKPYDLIVYNCQHFTSEIRTGKKISKQVENALATAFILLIVGALLSE